MLLVVQTTMAGSDVIITRDGTLVMAKVYKVAGDITYTDLSMKDGVKAIPTTKVYMVLRDNASTLYFDKDGKQTERATVKLAKNTDMLFFNDGKVLTVYGLGISNGEVTYKLDKNLTTPTKSTPVSDLFMVKTIDGSTMLLNQEATAWATRQPTVSQPAVSKPAVSQPVAPEPAQPEVVQRVVVKEEPVDGKPVTLPAKEQIPVVSVAAVIAAAEAADAQPAPLAQSEPPVQPELTSAMPEPPAQTVEPAVAPAVPEVAAQSAGMSVYELEKIVRDKNPYVLHHNDAMVEYRFQQGGYMIPYAGKTTFLQQRVSGFTAENGLLKVNLKQEYYNKKHAQDKAMASALQGSLFYVELDQEGNALLSHNVMHDFINVSKREGYGVILPSELTPGMSLKCGTVKDSGTDLNGKAVNRTLAYRDWYVESEEALKTEAGILPCVKITGRVSVSTSTGASTTERVTCWVSRNIGFVRYDSAVEGGSSKPVVLALVGMKNIR